MNRFADVDDHVYRAFLYISMFTVIGLDMNSINALDTQNATSNVFMGRSSVMDIL